MLLDAIFFWDHSHAMRLAFWTLFALVAMHMVVVGVYGACASSRADVLSQTMRRWSSLFVMLALPPHVPAGRVPAVGRRRDLSRSSIVCVS